MGTLRKFAECQKLLSEAEPVESSRSSSGKQQIKTIYSATKFEDTYRGFARLVLDPKLPAKVDAVRIFDNIVERASREMMQNLV